MTNSESGNQDTDHLAAVEAHLGALAAELATAHAEAHAARQEAAALRVELAAVQAERDALRAAKAAGGGRSWVNLSDLLRVPTLGDIKAQLLRDFVREASRPFPTCSWIGPAQA